MDDLISRQAAISAISYSEVAYYPGDTDSECLRRDSDVKQAIMGLPSVQSEQRWIPCSEQLPEDLAEVIITWVNHDPAPYYDFARGKCCSGAACFYKGSWYWYSSTCCDILAEYGQNEIEKMDDAIEVLAWMPLPEPYERRRE